MDHAIDRLNIEEATPRRPRGAINAERARELTATRPAHRALSTSRAEHFPVGQGIAAEHESRRSLRICAPLVRAMGPQAPQSCASPEVSMRAGTPLPWKALGVIGSPRVREVR